MVNRHGEWQPGIAHAQGLPHLHQHIGIPQDGDACVTAKQLQRAGNRRVFRVRLIPDKVEDVAVFPYDPAAKLRRFQQQMLRRFFARFFGKPSRVMQISSGVILIK